MDFSKHFKESQIDIAKEYSRKMDHELRQTIALRNQGKFDTAEMHLAHGLRLLGELRTMNISYLTEAEKARYSWM